MTELNSLIDEQEREIERSRGRAADLAHGLKTPLAALAGDVERLRHHGQSQIADDVQSVAEQMRRHVDRELTRARVKGARRYASGVRTELAPLVRSIIATIARTKEGEKLRFENAVPFDLSIPVERTDLADVLGNLIENASRFARQIVRVSAAREEIWIEDDGPGIRSKPVEGPRAWRPSRRARRRCRIGPGHRPGCARCLWLGAFLWVSRRA